MKGANLVDGRIPVIDLFAGPGGLGEGFSSVQDKQGDRVFKLALSVEKDPFAVQTLRLRAFVRSFDEPPAIYYDLARAQPEDQAVAIERMFHEFADAAEASRREVLPATLGGTKWETVYSEIELALDGVGANDPWVLIGGPPCQAYSLVGRARMRGKVESRTRARLHRLYEVYLRLLERYRPPVFVMENVKGLLSAKLDGQPIFRRILDHLRQPGGGSARYVVQPFVLSSRHPTSLFGSDGINGTEDHRRFLIKAEDFGIPQARHRVILLGLEQGLYERLSDCLPGLKEHGSRVGIADVISDLPRLRSGLSKVPHEAEAWQQSMVTIPKSAWVRWLRSNGHGAVADAVETAVRKMVSGHLERRTSRTQGATEPCYRADWFVDRRMSGISNHETRSHIREDLERYIFAACYASVQHRSPKLAEFPPHLHPDHKNLERAISEGLFGDRFKVQMASDSDGQPLPATTITSHISKDGHYYIHYDGSQGRSLTVREAARIQTFPDNYVFVGPRTEQYRQVGNAVPPLLACQIAETVAKILSPGRRLREIGALADLATKSLSS